MGHIFVTAFNAVLPILLLILLGYFLKKRKFLSGDFLKIGNKLVFRVCLPAMLFINVYDIDSFASIHWDMVIYCMAAVLGIFILGLVTALVGTPVPERKGVLLQCTFRSNFAIIGLPLAGALGGDEAMAVAAVVSAFTIPLFNILGVISLSMFVEKSGDGKHSVKKVMLGILKNPLIIGVLLGMLCLVIRAVQTRFLGSPVFTMKNQVYFLYKVLSNLKSIASPLALIVLGGQFEFSAVRGLRREILIGTFWRVILAPVLGIGCALLLSKHTGVLQCGSGELPALIALFGSPVAVSSAIMAGEMKNDEQLATQLVVWTSICSIGTIFAQVCILMQAGILVL